MMDPEMKAQIKAQAKAQADEIFAKLDRDGNGYIDEQELEQTMLNDPSCQPLPPDMAAGLDVKQQIAKFFAEADTNRDGRIDKPELVNFMDRMID